MSPGCPIARAALQSPDSLAVCFDERRITYAQLCERVQAAAAGFSERGIGPDSRVVLLANNQPDLLAAVFGAWRVGAAVVLLNTRLTSAELSVLASRARPAWVLADKAHEGRLEGSETLERLFVRSSRSHQEVPVAHRHPALMLYTSGTTGVPKAVVLSRENLDAAARASANRLGGQPSDRWLGTLPLFHIGGLMMAYRCAWAGAGLVLEQRFEAGRAWTLLTSEGITHASFVAVTLARLLDAAAGRAMPRTLRAALVGGGPVPRSLWQRARAAGVPALKTYGLTEASSQVCTEEPDRADGWTAGSPLSGIEVRVVQGDESVGVGVVGEVQVRGATVMSGYFDDARGTAAAFHDGWLRTGDLGMLEPDGRLRIEARRVDLLISGGENVYPAEIEAVLLEHTDIADAAVVGEPSEEWGQVPVAFVAYRQGARAVSLEGWCRARLAGFKVPRRFVAVPTMPRNAMGKVDRGALQAVLAQLRRSDGTLMAALPQTESEERESQR